MNHNHTHDDQLWDADEYDDEVDTIPCPECGSDVYEEAPQCPVCKTYISDHQVTQAGKPRWIKIVVTAIVSLLILSLLIPALASLLRMIESLVSR